MSRTKNPLTLALLLFPLLLLALTRQQHHAEAFVPLSSFTTTKAPTKSGLPLPHTQSGRSKHHSQTTCRLRHAPLNMKLPSWIEVGSPIASGARIAIASFLARLTISRFRNMKPGERFFYPNVIPDPAFSESLPDANLGCPFLGNLDAVVGSKSFGTGGFYLDKSRKFVGNAKKLWMYYFVGRPVVVIAGYKAIKNMLNSEFEPKGISTMLASGKKRLKETKRPE